MAAGGSLCAWWSTDPASFQVIAALMPARYVWLFGALTVVAGFVHNAFNNRSPKQ